MNEYSIERGEPVDLKTLSTKYIRNEEFFSIHKNTVILTHDVAINHLGGIILLKRNNHPEKGEWWPVGGRVKRGVSLEESLRQRAKMECGLGLDKIKEIGMGRCFFRTDPFDHGKGTDTFSIMFYAEGRGEIKLDLLHSSYRIVSPEVYPGLKNSLHPYVQETLEKAFQCV